MGSKFVDASEFLVVFAAIAVPRLLPMVAAVLLSGKGLLAGRTDRVLVLDMRLQGVGGLELRLVAMVAVILRSTGRRLMLHIVH